MQNMFSSFVRKGLSVIPVIPGQKRPGEFYQGKWIGLTDWSRYSKVMPNPEELSQWELWPNASIGLVCGELSGIIALDFDNHPDLGDKIQVRIPESPVRKKGEKGFTAFYKYNGEINLKKKYKGDTVVEILSTGNQTLLPPSVHPTGLEYVWLTEETLATIDKNDLPVLPANFIQIVDQVIGVSAIPQIPIVSSPMRGEHRSDTIEDVREALDYVSGYDEYDTWIKIGAAIYSEFPGNDGLAAWDNWSKQSSKYDAGEMPRKWASFKTMERVKIKSLFFHAIEGGYKQKRREKPIETKIIFAEETIPSPLEGSLKIENSIIENAPGLVGRIAAWINETALYPHPPLALGAALTMVGTLKAHRVRTSTNLRTNLNVLGLSPSGSGKGHAAAKVQQLLQAAGLESAIGGKFVSDSAVLKSLVNGGGRRFLVWDEIGIGIAEMTSKNSQGHKAAIIGLMMELFSAAGGTFYGKEYADHDGKMKRVDIQQPCLGVYGMTTSGRFYDALSGSHVLDGFLARWLIFETLNPFPKRRESLHIDDVPADLIAGCQAINEMPTNAISTGNIDQALHIIPRVVRLSEGAERAFKEALDKFDKNKETYFKRREGLDAIWARAGEHAIKIALTCEDSEEIQEQNISWAVNLVTSSINALCDMVMTRVSDNEQERLVNRVLGVVSGAGDGGISRSDLIRKTQWLQKKSRDDILDNLEESNKIERIKIETATNKAIKFRIQK